MTRAINETSHMEKGVAKPQVLLAHHLKALRLPTFLSQYEKVAGECAKDGTDHPRYLLRLAELELIDRERRMIDRQIRAARFPAVKTLDSFDFTAIPSLNKMLVLELARGEYILRRENVIALGPSGTGKSQIALALGLAACQRGYTTDFVTAAGLVHQLMEARDEKRLLKLQAHLASLKLLIIDELGYVPLTLTGAELLFEVFSQRYERGSTIVTSNLPFEDWTSVFGSERLTGALLDRLTHHVHILEMNGDSYRLKQSKTKRRKTAMQSEAGIFRRERMDAPVESDHNDLPPVRSRFLLFTLEYSRRVRTLGSRYPILVWACSTNLIMHVNDRLVLVQQRQGFLGEAECRSRFKSTSSAGDGWYFSVTFQLCSIRHQVRPTSTSGTSASRHEVTTRDNRRMLACCVRTRRDQTRLDRMTQAENRLRNGVVS